MSIAITTSENSLSIPRNISAFDQNFSTELNILIDEVFSLDITVVNRSFNLLVEYFNGDYATDGELDYLFYNNGNILEELIVQPGFEALRSAVASAIFDYQAPESLLSDEDYNDIESLSSEEDDYSIGLPVIEEEQEDEIMGENSEVASGDLL